MYSLVNALVLENTPEAQYSTVDVSTTPINILYSLYSEIYLTLSNPYMSSNVYVDLIALKNQLAGYSGLISAWLGNIGNLTLPTIAQLPTVNIKYARYSDGAHAGYKLNLCKIGFQIPLNYPPDMLPDLRISRPNYNTDIGLINKYCLTTVNGYLHQTSYDGTYSYIQNGAVTMRKSNINNFGILSFLDIGTVTTMPIDTTKVYADTSNPLVKYNLADKMYLNINTSITNMTVLLSLGGYLVLPDNNIFRQIGNNTFCINTSSLPLLERYYESNNYIDLSSLGLNNGPLSSTMINSSQFLSDAVLLKYLQLPQSFWIIINTPTFSYSPQFIESGRLPGSFVGYKKPINPLFVGYGRMAEYWSVYEDGQYSINVDNSFLMNYMFPTNPGTSNTNINSAQTPWRPYKDSIGYTLQIHT